MMRAKDEMIWCNSSLEVVKVVTALLKCPGTLSQAVTLLYSM